MGIPSLKSLPCPLLILKADGDSIEFVCDGSVFKMSDVAALRETLVNSHGPTAACTVSSLRAAQRATRGQHAFPSQQSTPLTMDKYSDNDAASGCLAKAISFVRYTDALHSANNSEDAENRQGEIFKSGSSTTGALLCTRADAECTEFLFEGNVYRVHEKVAFEDIARAGCPRAQRSVSSILAAQRATRKARAKDSFHAQSLPAAVPSLSVSASESL